MIGQLKLDNVRDLSVTDMGDDEYDILFAEDAASSVAVFLTGEEMKELFLEMAKHLPPEWLGEQHWRP